jgi:hypothetical protein
VDALTAVLRAAADEAPDRLDGGDRTREAWRRGRRRRTVRHAAAAGAVVALVAVLVSLVATPFGLPRAAVPAGEPRPGVTSYPQRIGPQLWLRDLPPVAPPLAALVQVSGTEGPLSWQAVTPAGVRYRIVAEDRPGDFYPVLSDDGTVLAALATSRGPLVVRDLAAGRVVEVDDIGGMTDEGPDQTRYALQGQSPGFVSPDDRAVALLLMDGSSPNDGFVGVVDTMTGSVTEVRGMRQAAGWLDDRRLVGRTFGDGPGDIDSPVRVVVWDRATGRTETLGEVPLGTRPDDAVSGLDGQWWGRVRPDGTLWLQAAGNLATHVLGVSLPDLAPVRVDGSPSPQPVWSAVGSGAWSEVRWAGTVPVTAEQDWLLAGPDGPLVVTGPASGIGQAVWSQDALDGGPEWTPWGTDTGWWSWWWGAALAGVALVWLWGARENRRRTDGIRPPGAPGRAATPPSAGGR